MLAYIFNVFEGSTKAELIGDFLGVVCLFVLVGGLAWGLPVLHEVAVNVLP